MTELADIDKLNDFAAAVNDGSWLKEKFPEKDWHRCKLSGDGTKTWWCDGTASDCDRKTGRP